MDDTWDYQSHSGCFEFLGSFDNFCDVLGRFDNFGEVLGIFSYASRHQPKSKFHARKHPQIRVYLTRSRSLLRTISCHPEYPKIIFSIKIICTKEMFGNVQNIVGFENFFYVFNNKQHQHKIIHLFQKESFIFLKHKYHTLPL